MLIEFRVWNFKSFKEEAVFPMTNVKSFKELEDTNLISTNREFSLLKSAAIFGGNGSGKSNFIYAMNTMGSIVFGSFGNSLLQEQDRPSQNYQFALNTSTESAETGYEVSILIGSEIYRYGFEINGYEIVSEWLFRKKEREVNLFSRSRNNKFEINTESFKEGLKFKSEVNQNVLFISHLSQNNQEISKRIHQWFLTMNVISGLHEKYYEKFTAALLKQNKNFKNWATEVMKFLEISNIEAGEHEGEIVTYHNKFDENGLFVESIPFKAKDESEGTKKLVHILGPIYDSLTNGKILFIDELDSKLHPNLSKGLIKLFHEFNLNNAQIIFSAQDSSLLNKDIFRRDQIWFAEKDQFGASTLYPLSDFSSSAVRNTSAFDKKYLKNEFGSASPLQITEKIKELLYEPAR